MRERGVRLIRPLGSAVLLITAAAAAGCEPVDPALVPDERLQAELGLTEKDRVHTVELRTGVGEEAGPDSVEVRPGDLVQFVSGDGFVHEVHFELDSISAPQGDFLRTTGQDASPPLIEEDARFVLTFSEAPPGRYPYRLLGNREPGHGVIVVASPDAR